MHMQIGSQMGHFLISGSYDSMSKFDEARMKIQNDTSLQKLIAEAGNDGLFIPGTTTSSIWEKI